MRARNGTRGAEAPLLHDIRELGYLVLALLGAAVELADGQYGHLEFFGQQFEGAGELGHFGLP